ncbi:MAG: glycosyltransferase [Candidatus Omnitrophica bacterium]|nr:glycosyltransferase [Candidatus Omnitrophota bacterium]
MKVDILVLNYNGESLLRQFLPSIQRAAQSSQHECSVCVVDNCSTDDSVPMLRTLFSGVSVYVAEKNEVLCSYNHVIEHLKSDIVILLNNDIKVKEDFVDNLVACFKQDDSIFFAAPQILNFDNTFNGGKSYLCCSWGIMQNRVADSAGKGPGITHSIATGAFRREDFLLLNGFDTLFLPGIWEEVDLCYRAMLRGKRGVFEPKSIIWHQESTTFNKVYGARRKTIIAHRNMFLFFWKNIRDPVMLGCHFLFLPLRLLISLGKDKGALLEGFFQALPLLPCALARRRAEARFPIKRILKDKDIVQCR